LIGGKTKEMVLFVKLQDVVDAMEEPVDGWMACVNRGIGNMISFAEDDVAFHDDDDDVLPDWQAEMVAKAKNV
jgi:hypothetical protein